MTDFKLYMGRPVNSGLFFYKERKQMDSLHIDIETYSSTDLTKAGVHKYVEAPDFDITLFAYAFNDDEVTCIDLASGEKLPDIVLQALKDPEIIKMAFNAMFERVCLTKYLGHYLPPEQWHCNMVHSLYLALPGSLAAVGAVLGLDRQKLEEGKKLIKLFAIPDKNGKRVWPKDRPEEWALYKKYNIRDVETEMDIGKKLMRFPVPDQVWQEYALDQRINDLGVRLDETLVKNAIKMDEESKDRYFARAQVLTGLENPNSPIQIKEWLQGKGIEIDSLSKEAVADLVKKTEGDVKEVLELRLLLSKSSVKKYQAMEACRCSDERAHGLLQFAGTRTLRWAGRLIQVQNLPAASGDEAKRSLVKAGNAEAVELLYDSLPDALSQCIRTAFIPAEGKKFVVADYAQIEARTLAWLAGEKWRQELFKENGDIYCGSASQMFHVPVVKNGENGHLRKSGKIAELALGYGGSVGAMVSMGAIKMGLEEDSLQEIVDKWRGANKNIVKFWWEVDKTVISAIKEKKPVTLKGITFYTASGFLVIKLPSGRSMFYARPRITMNSYGRESVSYEGVAANHKWERIESYGPKFVENITQAIARDILAAALMRLWNAGYPVVMHVHDEAICEVPESVTVDEVCSLMAKVPPWAKGLILNAAGFECKFYQKD